MRYFLLLWFFYQLKITSNRLPMAFSLAEVGDLAYKLFVCGGSSPPLYNDVSFVRSTESTYKALTHSADMCTFN